MHTGVCIKSNQLEYSCQNRFETVHYLPDDIKDYEPIWWRLLLAPPARKPSEVLRTVVENILVLFTIGKDSD